MKTDYLSYTKKVRKDTTERLRPSQNLNFCTEQLYFLKGYENHSKRYFLKPFKTGQYSQRNLRKLEWIEKEGDFFVRVTVEDKIARNRPSLAKMRFNETHLLYLLQGLQKLINSYHQLGSRIKCSPSSYLLCDDVKISYVKLENSTNCYHLYSDFKDTDQAQRSCLSRGERKWVAKFIRSVLKADLSQISQQIQCYLEELISRLKPKSKKKFRITDITEGLCSDKEIHNDFQSHLETHGVNDVDQDEDEEESVMYIGENAEGEYENQGENLDEGRCEFLPCNSQSQNGQKESTLEILKNDPNIILVDPLTVPLFLLHTYAYLLNKVQSQSHLIDCSNDEDESQGYQSEMSNKTHNILTNTIIHSEAKSLVEISTNELKLISLKGQIHSLRLDDRIVPHGYGHELTVEWYQELRGRHRGECLRGVYLQTDEEEDAVREGLRREYGRRLFRVFQIESGRYGYWLWGAC